MRISMMRSLLLVGVCASVVAAETTPKYVNSRVIVDQALNTLIALTSPLPSPEQDREIPCPKHNYIILVAVIDKMVEELLLANMNFICPQPYDKLYWEVVNTTIPEAWKHPEEVLKTVNNKIKIFRKQINPIVKLIEKYCGKVYTVQCDEAVDLEVKGNHGKYDQPAKTLLVAAELGKKYLEDTYADEAEKNDITTFLLNKGLTELKDLVLKLLLVIKTYSSPKCAEL